eukprot:1157753-Pelagomonas_calceolata.AAC.6
MKLVLSYPLSPVFLLYGTATQAYLGGKKCSRPQMPLGKLQLSNVIAPIPEGLGAMMFELGQGIGATLLDCKALRQSKQHMSNVRCSLLLDPKLLDGMAACTRGACMHRDATLLERRASI